MKNLFKKPMHKALGLSIAMALGSMATSVSAVPSMDNLGDMAIVPYYTVEAGFVSGIHITNTSDSTQVVKVTYHKASDSSEVTDFIVVLSPHDQFTGFVRPATDGIHAVEFVPTDNSCVVPWLDLVGATDGGPDGRRDPIVAGQRVDSNGALVSEGIPNAAGSRHGYISVIAMGQTDGEQQQIAKDALHSGAFPSNCARVASNFHAVRTPANLAVITDPANVGANIPIAPVHFNTNPITLTSSTTGYSGPFIINGLTDTGVVTHTDTVSVLQAATDTSPAIHAISNYVDTDDRALAVSYLIRNINNGIEFGNSAEHFEGFAADLDINGVIISGAMMSNQEYGVDNLDKPRRQRDTGYQFPNLNGGSSYNGAQVGLIDAVNLGYGATAISNDWAASSIGIGTDWVVTFPGQDVQTGGSFAPIGVTVNAWNREEGAGDVLSGLVVSPGVGSSAASSGQLGSETNIVTWRNNTSTSQGQTLGATSDILAVTLTDTAYQADATVPNHTPRGNAAGWAKIWLGTTDATGVFAAATEATSHLDLAEGKNAWILGLNPATAGEPRIPVVGFAAWGRQFPSLPAASYGRIIQHSRYRSDHP